MVRMMIASLSLAVATTLVAGAASATSAEVVGDQSRWSLDFRASMEQASTPLTGIHIIATWKSTIVAVRTGEYDAQLQLANLHFKGDAVKDASPAALAVLEGRLSRPFWASCRADGGLLQMHFLRGVSPSDRNILQMIATDLQLVRPALQSRTQATPESWTAQERDGAGEYSALYVAQPGRITKRKLTYLYTDGVAGAPSGAVHISVDKSEIVFAVAADQRVQAIDGTNSVRMDLSQDMSQKLVATTEFHVNHLQTGKAPELIGSLERAHDKVVDSAIVTQRPDANTARADADDRLLKGLTTKTVLEQAFAKGTTSSAQPDRLTALFRSRAEAAPEAEMLLIKNGSRRLVTNALGAAGSSSAVTVLGELARNANLSKELRVDALVAFVQMKHPTVESMQIPKSMMRDPNPAIQSAARMMSGALSRLGRVEHPGESDAIDAKLLGLYRNAAEASERAELLAALGNSAGPATLPAIEEALRDSAAPIRSAAARALRLATDADADRTLATVLVHDSAPTVRADAIFATQFRRPLSPELMDALLQVVNSDKSIYVRSDAVAVLSQNADTSPKISKALAQVAANDPDPGIRRQAKSAVGTPSLAPSTMP